MQQMPMQQMPMQQMLMQQMQVQPEKKAQRRRWKKRKKTNVEVNVEVKDDGKADEESVIQYEQQQPLEYRLMQQQYHEDMVREAVKQHEHAYSWESREENEANCDDNTNITNDGMTLI